MTSWFASEILIIPTPSVPIAVTLSLLPLANIMNTPLPGVFFIASFLGRLCGLLSFSLDVQSAFKSTIPDMYLYLFLLNLSSPRFDELLWDALLAVLRAEAEIPEFFAKVSSSRGA